MEGSSDGPAQLSIFEFEFFRIHFPHLDMTGSNLGMKFRREMHNGTNNLSIFQELPRRGTRNYSFQRPRLGIDPSRQVRLHESRID